MKAALHRGTGKLVAGLAALAAFGGALLAVSDNWATHAAPQADVPACSACDARHARLVHRRAAQSGVSE